MLDKRDMVDIVDIVADIATDKSKRFMCVNCPDSVKGRYITYGSEGLIWTDGMFKKFCGSVDVHLTKQQELKFIEIKESYK